MVELPHKIYYAYGENKKLYHAASLYSNLHTDMLENNDDYQLFNINVIFTTISFIGLQV